MSQVSTSPHLIPLWEVPSSQPWALEYLRSHVPFRSLMPYSHLIVTDIPIRGDVAQKARDPLRCHSPAVTLLRIPVARHRLKPKRCQTAVRPLPRFSIPATRRPYTQISRHM
ncbi:hypothetical protein PAXRUDRAFT_10006 [Paxillus rubicundulus Ve08.2h10]|uniref:Uncharacterized protein n=1 Tax=Paxillus rubicundulus Ve08.2h10 TaxID=930991 RepID=A0A0D0EBJ2_9AGAM|nr:hypothetical protein PAXRUDRAFT_10006 [Paxillus rubicundulus Ve08.2h10]